MTGAGDNNIHNNTNASKAPRSIVCKWPRSTKAHSLRSGFLTSAARRGASVFKMRAVSRHKSMDVLRAYVRDADLFRDHAGAGLL
jgi:hypothetical protein